MAKAVRSKPKEDLIPANVGAAWKRASEVRFRKVPHTDLSTVFDWIVSIMTPAARGKPMSELVERGSIAVAARKDRREGARVSARPGRRKGLQTSGLRQRRKAVRVPARQGPQKGVRAPVRQERRKGTRQA